MTKVDFTLSGLHCAHCAGKIEDAVAKLPAVENTTLDFTNQRLSVTLSEEQTPTDLMAEIQKLATKIEPGVLVKTHEKRPHGEDHPHDHDHAHSHGGGHNIPLAAIRLGASLCLLFLGMSGILHGPLSLAVLLGAYLLAGADVLWSALRHTLRGNLMDENFLMALATVGALLIHQYPEAAAVMIFYQIGELFQELALNRSRKSIQSLLDIQPKTARRIGADGDAVVEPEDILPGEMIRVLPGERVPLDGILTAGESTLDLSALTGESVPVWIKPGDAVLSGAINQSGVVELRVTKPYTESTVARILSLVEDAAGRKAPTEQFITRFARIYTPAVVIGAALLAFVPPLILTGATLQEWVYRALIFLVVSCPCALVLSIPLSFFGGIGAASKAGILIKGSNYLEALNNVETVVFDKTGTLTAGRFTIVEKSPVEGITEEALLQVAAYLENHSTHPIARSIVGAYAGTLNSKQLSEVREIPGKGVVGNLDGIPAAVGNGALMESLGIEIPETESILTQVHVALNHQWMGTLILEDAPKPDAKRAIEALKPLGVAQTILLTGDSTPIAENIGKRLGIDRIYAQLLPEDKLHQLEALLKSARSNKKTIFVGDGINDAPVLARADIGIAMGALGSDAAIESADVVLMTDEPSKVAEAIEIARETRKIVLQNIVFALSVKALVLILGAGGLATLWEAVFADVGVALIAILNAMRLVNRKGASK